MRKQLSITLRPILL